MTRDGPRGPTGGDVEEPGILAAGAYVPRYRIPAATVADAWGRFAADGIERTAVPAADEDALTMAAEAGRRALDACGVTGAAIDVLAFATTTPPLEETDLTVRLGAMLDTPDDAGCLAFTASTRAGTRAMTATLDALAAGTAHAGGDGSDGAGRALVVASDCPRGEPESAADHAAGAGAAAFVLGPDAPVRIVDRSEHAAPFPGTRFRRRGSDRVEGLGVTSYDRRAFTEALAGAVDGLDGELTDDGSFDAAAVQAPDGAMPYRAADALGVTREGIRAVATVEDLGDTGAASVPLSLAVALADGHESILAAAFGSGTGADALSLVASGDVPTALSIDGETTCTYPEFLRLRGDITAGPPAGGGAHVSVPSWRRTLPQRYRLVAGRCPDCGALAFPPEGSCPECGALVAYTPVELPGTGTVEAVTTVQQGGAPPEFAEQQAREGPYAVAIVAFDGPGDGSGNDADDGRSVSVPAQVTGADPDALAVGDRVRAVLRRVYTQEGVPRYGFKVRSTGTS